MQCSVSMGKSDPPDKTLKSSDAGPPNKSNPKITKVSNEESNKLISQEKSMIILNATRPDKALLNTIENCTVKHYSSLIETPPPNSECFHFDSVKHAETCFELLKISKTSPNIKNNIL